MSRFVKTRFICASCGTERKEVNHWYVVCAGRDTKIIYFVSSLDINVTRLDDAEYPVCGQQCLISIESKILEGVAI